MTRSTSLDQTTEVHSYKTTLMTFTTRLNWIKHCWWMKSWSKIGHRRKMLQARRHKRNRSTKFTSTFATVSTLKFSSSYRISQAARKQNKHPQSWSMTTSTQTQLSFRCVLSWAMIQLQLVWTRLYRQRDLRTHRTRSFKPDLTIKTTFQWTLWLKTPLTKLHLWSTFQAGSSASTRISTISFQWRLSKCHCTTMSTLSLSVWARHLSRLTYLMCSETMRTVHSSWQCLLSATTSDPLHKLRWPISVTTWTHCTSGWTWGSTSSSLAAAPSWFRFVSSRSTTKATSGDETAWSTLFVW